MKAQSKLSSFLSTWMDLILEWMVHLCILFGLYLLKPLIDPVRSVASFTNKIFFLIFLKWKHKM